MCVSRVLAILVLAIPIHGIGMSVDPDGAPGVERRVVRKTKKLADIAEKATDLVARNTSCGPSGCCASGVHSSGNVAKCTPIHDPWTYNGVTYHGCSGTAYLGYGWGTPDPDYSDNWKWDSCMPCDGMTTHYGVTITCEPTPAPPTPAPPTPAPAPPTHAPTPAPTTHCVVTLYEHWPEGITEDMATSSENMRAAVNWWQWYPTGLSTTLRGDGKFNLTERGMSNKVSSVKIDGACCKATAYTDEACTNASGALKKHDIAETALGAGVFAPATNLELWWGCNDCAKCIEVVYEPGCSQASSIALSTNTPTPSPTSSPTPPTSSPTTPTPAPTAQATYDWAIPAHCGSTCCWQYGDGYGGSESRLQFGVSTPEECEQVVRTQAPTATGATYGSNMTTRFGECYAEYNWAGTYGGPGPQKWWSCKLE